MSGPATPTATSTFHRFAVVAKDAVFLASLIVTLFGVLGSVALKLAWPMFIDRLREDLNVITREDLSRLEEQLNQVTGDDRLIRMPSGHSFVREPVSVSEHIQLNLIIGQTNRGIACNLLEITPLFVDERTIPIAGEAMKPFSQLQMEPRRFQFDLEHPATLVPGRVALSLGLKFACPFGVGGIYIDVYEETDAVFFQLDP